MSTSFILIWIGNPLDPLDPLELLTIFAAKLVFPRGLEGLESPSTEMVCYPAGGDINLSLVCAGVAMTVMASRRQWICAVRRVFAAQQLQLSQKT